MPTKFRPDIQGLRALAVLLVVLYHSGVTVLGGGYIGVDVFFVISGFLITSHLWTELAERGRLRFGAFYARRIRRILPASFVVLALTVVASLIWLPPLQQPPMLLGAAATSLYVPNVLFWRQGTDYLAETAPSVFQHYWSLGIEEQFYLVWPVLMVLVFLLFKRSRRGLTIALVVVAGLSLVASIVITPVSQPAAFFLLPTRAWELATGGIIAMIVISSPAWLRTWVAPVLAWIGVVLIGVAALFFTSSTPFPGWSAVLPVSGAALVILGGSGGGFRFGPQSALAVPPLQFFGKISYSLYLVHWPLLVIPQEAVGLANPLPLWATLGLGALAIPLAWLSWRFVEEPTRNARFLTRHRPRFTIVTALVVSVALAGCSLAAYVGVRSTALETSVTVPSAPLAQFPLGTAFVPQNLHPSLRASDKDVPSIYSDGCHRDLDEADPTGCSFGDNPGAPLVALFGDSHAAQWFPALEPLASAGTIRLDVYTKNSCSSANVGSERSEGCEQWRDGVIAELDETKPDVVLLGNFARQYGAESSPARSTDWASRLSTTVGRLAPESEVLILADTPSGRVTPGICLSAHLNDAAACALPRDTAIREDIREVERNVGDGYLDLTNFICNDNVCPAVIADLLVYRDSHHLTAAFAEALSPQIRVALAPYL